jgi:peptide/nickel transport system substrate-binding protein
MRVTVGRALRARFGLVSLVLVLGTTACEPRHASPRATTVTLRIGVALPPLQQRRSVDGISTSITAEPLVSIGFDGRPQARLAESWEPLTDGPGFLLKLRPRVFFHNGQPADAERVARILRDQIATFKLAGWAGPENIKEISAPTSDEIVIRSYRPDAFLLPDLTGYSIADLKDPLLRTGPFKIVSQKPAAALAAFDGYYLGRPPVDAIEIQPYQTQRKAWIAMMRGEVNALYEVSREAADFVEAESAVKTYPLLRGYHIALVFNQIHPILARREVRVALSEAVDREAIVRDAMRGRGQRADGPIWPDHWAYSSAQRVYTHNPDAARVRLDAAGFRLRSASTRGLMDSRFRFTCVVPADDARFERIALVLQRQLFEIGVDMDIQAIPTFQLVDRFRTGNFDAFLFEMTSGRTLSWVYRFWHSPLPGAPPNLRTGYSAADNALDRLRGARSDDETRIAVSDLQSVLYDDPPAIFLAWPRETRAVDAQFNVPYLRDRDVLTSVREWRLTPPELIVSR